MQVINIPQVPTPPAPDIFFRAGPPDEVLIAIVAVVAILVAGLILTPLARALARRIEGKHVDSGVAAELERLRNRVGELEEVEHRVAELEERVDFSERLLTQGREQPVIGGEK